MTPGARPWPLRPLGGTGLEVPPLCFGGGPLGSMPATFGYEVPAEQAKATVRAVLDGPAPFLDTAASYGDGESERRIGAVLAERGGVPPGVLVATKVDRDLRTGEFSGAQVRRSLERSGRLLGMDRFPLVHLHDPEHVSFEDGVAPGGPLEALLDLQAEGVVDHLGVAGGPVDLLRRYLDTGAFEVLITHNRWTVVDRSAGELIDAAVERGVAVVNAAVFGGGLLVQGTADQRDYAYRRADPRVIDRVRALERLCRRHDVPLGAVALQFSMRDPRITSSIVGVATPGQVRQAVTMSSLAIPEEIWPEVDALAAPRETWLW